MKEKTLFIIAAGLSSRMNGIPKHLCKIDNETNLKHTLKISFSYFDNIYVVINEKLDNKFCKQTEDICREFSNVRTIKIESGKGDLHAIYNAINSINFINKDIYCIWGDTYFKDDYIFSEMMNQGDMCGNQLIGVFCAKEYNPYAFIKNYPYTNVIVETGFREETNIDDTLYHDQSAFRINSNLFNSNFEKYSEKINNELYLLNRFYKIKNIEFEYSIIKFLNWCAGNCVSSNVVYELKEPVAQSYNTIEELTNINV